MLASLKLDDEQGRLSALNRYGMLDSSSEEGFDQILELVQRVFAMPMAAVTLVDSERQWFKARRGLGATETPRSMAFCHHTIAAADGLAVEDALLDSRFAENALVQGEPHIRSYMGAPLRTPDGYQVGALCVIGSDRRRFSRDERDILQRFSEVVVSHMELRQLASCDGLTGVLSRRAFDQAVFEVIEAQRRGDDCRQGQALAILDIDHFKRINDTHGHGVGDTVLVAVAKALKATLGMEAMVGRLGGEEFGVLFTAEDRAAATRCAEALRTAVAAVRIDRDLVVTCSIGVALLTPERESPEAWMHVADTALYAAKWAGRNRVELG